MQGKLTLHALFSVSEQGFSVDELVKRIEAEMGSNGLPWIAQLILELMQEVLIVRALNHRHECPSYMEPCCAQPSLELHSSRTSKRGLRTAIGNVTLTWRRLRCRHCQRVHTPLRTFLGLVPWQSRSHALEQIVAETVADQSYRRSAGHLVTIGRVPVPKSTAHRWVVESDCDEMDCAKEYFESIMADGTGFKRRPDPSAGQGNKGELRFIIGTTLEGKTMPLGIWTTESWQQIAEGLAARAESLPLSEYLLSDGEPAIADHVGPLAEVHQRCQWHLPRGLEYALREDQAAKSRRAALTEQLRRVIAIEVPAGDYDELAEGQVQSVKTQIERAREQVDELHRSLLRQGFDKAATYIRSARDKMFTYLEYWLKYGLNCPRTTSLIERLMRELARRLKRMAFGWSDKGAGKLARIIIKRILTPGKWKEYWNRKMRIDGKVHFQVLGVNPAQAL